MHFTLTPEYSILRLMRTGSTRFGKWHRIIFSERNFGVCVSSCAQFGNDFRENQNSLNKHLLSLIIVHDHPNKWRSHLKKKNSNYIILVTKGRYVIFEVPFCFGTNHRKICTTRIPLASPNKNKNPDFMKSFKDATIPTAKQKYAFWPYFQVLWCCSCWS